MTNEFKKEMLKDIQWTANTCNNWAETALNSKRDLEILENLDEVRTWASFIMKKVELYKQYWHLDNQ